MIISDPMDSDSLAIWDAWAVCYAFELMRYTDIELIDVVEAIRHPDYEGCIAAERELKRRESL